MKGGHIMINSVGQVGIPVKNIERATAFYQGTLELPLLFYTDTMAFLQSGDVRILLTLPEKQEYDHPSSVVYFNVENTRTAYLELRNKGVEVSGEPHVVSKMGDVETWMCFFKDSEGNTHAFMSEEKAE